jgi:hypothetical protein
VFARDFLGTNAIEILRKIPRREFNTFCARALVNVKVTNHQLNA